MLIHGAAFLCPLILLKACVQLPIPNAPCMEYLHRHAQYVFFLSQGNPSMRVAAASEAIVIGDKLNHLSYLVGG